jgi:hypothetical protein
MVEGEKVRPRRGSFRGASVNALENVQGKGGMELGANAIRTKLTNEAH